MSQNFQKFVKFQKFQFDNLVDFEKCCKTHIYLQKSVPIQPKTSNILPKFCQKLATTLRVRPDAVRPPRSWLPPLQGLAARCGALSWLSSTEELAALELLLRIFEKCIFRKCIFQKCIFRKCIFRKCIFRKFCKFLAGSFSAVSKRNFARKYAFDSIFQALQDLHPFAPLQSQNFHKKSV